MTYYRVTHTISQTQSAVWLVSDELSAQICIFSTFSVKQPYIYSAFTMEVNTKEALEDVPLYFSFVSSAIVWS